MYKSQKVLMLLAVLIFSGSSLFAQGLSASADVDVLINVKKSLSISYVTGELDFGDVIVGASGDQTIAPEFGAKFKVDGHNSGTVSITFGDANLTAGTTTDLTFKPVVHSTLGNSTYGGATPTVITTGNAQAMTDIGGGTGELYLWVGGGINVSGAEQGDYAGLFTMTVAY